MASPLWGGNVGTYADKFGISASGPRGHAGRASYFDPYRFQPRSETPWQGGPQGSGGAGLGTAIPDYQDYFGEGEDNSWITKTSPGVGPVGIADNPNQLPYDKKTVAASGYLNSRPGYTGFGRPGPYNAGAERHLSQQMFNPFNVTDRNTELINDQSPRYGPINYRSVNPFGGLVEANPWTFNAEQVSGPRPEDVADDPWEGSFDQPLGLPFTTGSIPNPSPGTAQSMPPVNGGEWNKYRAQMNARGTEMLGINPNSPGHWDRSVYKHPAWEEGGRKPSNVTGFTWPTVHDPGSMPPGWPSPPPGMHLPINDPNSNISGPIQMGSGRARNLAREMTSLASYVNSENVSPEQRKMLMNKFRHTLGGTGYRAGEIEKDPNWSEDPYAWEGTGGARGPGSLERAWGDMMNTYDTGSDPERSQRHVGGATNPYSAQYGAAINEMERVMSDPLMQNLGATSNEDLRAHLATQQPRPGLFDNRIGRDFFQFPAPTHPSDGAPMFPTLFGPGAAEAWNTHGPGYGQAIWQQPGNPSSPGGGVPSASAGGAK